MAKKTGEEKKKILEKNRNLSDPNSPEAINKLPSLDNEDTRTLSEKIVAGGVPGFGGTDASGRNEKQRQELGQAFISERERALGRGETKRQANETASAATQNIGLDQFDPGANARVNEDLNAIANPNLNLPPTIPNQNLPSGSNVLAGLGAGAATELAAGARVGIGAALLGSAPISLPIAGAVAAAGFVTGIFLSMRSEAKSTIKAEASTLAQNRGNLNQFIADVNLGINTEDAIDSFRSQLEAIDQAYSSLKFTGSIKNKIVGADNREAMRKFEDFYAPGGDRERAVNQMFIAKNAPNPALGAQMLNNMAANREPLELSDGG